MEKDLIKEKLEEHNRRLDKHEDKIDVLEKNDAISSQRIDNLWKSLDNLTSTLKWLCGFFITGLVLIMVFFIEQVSRKL